MNVIDCSLLPYLTTKIVQAVRNATLSPGLEIDLPDIPVFEKECKIPNLLYKYDLAYSDATIENRALILRWFKQAVVSDSRTGWCDDVFAIHDYREVRRSFINQFWDHDCQHEYKENLMRMTTYENHPPIRDIMVLLGIIRDWKIAERNIETGDYDRMVFIRTIMGKIHFDLR